jgi:hypothetical protein
LVWCIYWYTQNIQEQTFIHEETERVQWKS